MDKPRCVDMGHTLFVDSCRQHMGMVMSTPGSSEITREHEEEGGYRCIWCGSNVNDWADQICIPRIGNKVIPEPDSSESGLDWAREKFNCPECGEGVVVDDKGWCTTCGNNRIRQRTSQAGGSAPRVDTKYDDGTHGGKYPYLDSMSTSPDESDQAVSGEPEAKPHWAEFITYASVEDPRPLGLEAARLLEALKEIREVEHCTDDTPATIYCDHCFDNMVRAFFNTLAPAEPVEPEAWQIDDIRVHLREHLKVLCRKVNNDTVTRGNIPWADAVFQEAISRTPDLLLSEPVEGEPQGAREALEKIKARIQLKTPVSMTPAELDILIIARTALASQAPAQDENSG